MENLSKWIFLTSLVFLSGCGVKGRPLPPLNPAPIGQGKSNYQDPQKQTPKKQIQPNNLGGG